MRTQHQRRIRRLAGAFCVGTAMLATLLQASFANALATPGPVLAVHAGGEFARPILARLAVSLDVGLTQGLGARLQAGPTFGATGVGGLLLAGPTWTLDVASWVPKLGVLAGLRLPSTTAEVQVGGEVARYVNLSTSVGVGAWAVWRQHHGFAGVASLLLAREF